ncbi:hypothetical protein [Aquimarina spinulae]|uniref:hypothetical protein n=1 Tax=Aquimarina spinulae TaxID=1192023 RepID=UPI000D550A6D|nr:hypothetical protein [Aquimarina spinulae]
MFELFTIALSKILLGIEFLSALVAVFYFFKLKNTFWKWFCVYLIIILIQEFYWYFNTPVYDITKQEYYAFIGIPIQYLFFFWLYALKSLKRKMLFIIFSVIYISTIPIEIYLSKLNIVYSLNLTIGTLLLTLLIILELKKQIKTDDILRFKENKMFYINIGVVLFYIGTYPFFAFYDLLLQEPYLKIGDMYYLYFRISICLMYLAFIASFIWGKHHLK